VWLHVQIECAHFMMNFFLFLLRLGKSGKVAFIGLLQLLFEVFLFVMLAILYLSIIFYRFFFNYLRLQHGFA
jgi:hypothetical protein